MNLRAAKAATAITLFIVLVMAAIGFGVYLAMYMMREATQLQALGITVGLILAMLWYGIYRTESLE